jgi:hypothetical protein
MEQQIESIEITLPPRENLVLPPLADILGGLRVEPWVADRYEEAARGASVFDAAAAAGSVLRHATPTDDEPAGDALERAERCAEPARRILAWAAALDAGTTELLARVGCERAQGLEETLGTLVASIAEARPDAAVAAKRWLRSRDDLESLCVLLYGHEPSRAVLRDAIDTLDAEAELHATAWGELGPLDDPQLRAALVGDPDIWWGRLL